MSCNSMRRIRRLAILASVALLFLPASSCTSPAPAITNLPEPTGTPAAYAASAQATFPTASPEQTLPDKRLAKAIQVNGDVVGWITIPGTSIDFPVVQGADNIFYLTHDARKRKSRSGAIFMHYLCDAGTLRGNVVIYGHHMRDKSMFAPLINYKNSGFIQDHGIIELSTPYEMTRWEVFAAYATTPEFHYIKTKFASDQEYLLLIQEMQKKSLFQTDTVLTAEDDVLTLSTCAYDYKDERFVVNARRIK
jgi:sortase B